MRVELDKRTAALDDLQRRLAALQPVPAGEAPAPLPPPPPTPEPAASPSPPRFDFYGESKVRYETLVQDFDECMGCPDRRRGRLRLRFGANGRLSPNFTAAVGFGLGELNDANTVYANLGNKFSRKVATWDRGYVEYHPMKVPWMRVTAGKFPYTWLRSSMTFDVDFFPEGLSERFSFDLQGDGPIENVGLQAFQLIAGEQPADIRTTVVGGQLLTRFTPAPRLSTLVAITALDVNRPESLLRGQLSGADVGVRNTNAVVVRDGQVFYASGFGYLNAILETAIRTPWDALPVTLGLEYQRNVRASSNRDTALSARLDAGRAQRGGDWEFGWHLFRVDQDAILSALGESDWRGPSNVLQHRFAVNRMVNPNVQLSYTLYRGRTLDHTLPGALLAPGLPASRRDPWTNRMYFDVTYRY